MQLKHRIFALVAVLALSSQSRAANLVIDDSDLNTVTITVSGFANFGVNGTPLANGASATFVDGVIFNFGGTWFNQGAGTGPTQSAYFGDTELRSGLQFDALPLPNTLLAYVDTTGTHAFLGYDPAFHTDGIFDPLLPQDGSTASGSLPGLTWSFKSELATVPDTGATVFLVSGACIGLAAFRRRKTR